MGHDKGREVARRSKDRWVGLGRYAEPDRQRVIGYSAGQEVKRKLR
jgi:hypothetical protein